MTSNANFGMDFDIELKWRLIQTIWKDLNNFSKIERNFNIEMTKMPFFMNFANNIEIKCRGRCNWSETVQMTYNARKEELNWYF